MFFYYPDLYPNIQRCEVGWLQPAPIDRRVHQKSRYDLRVKEGERMRICLIIWGREEGEFRSGGADAENRTRIFR